MKTKKTKEKRKKTKKQLVFQFVLIAAIVVAGLASGFYCGNLYLSTKFKKPNYNFAEADILPNFEEVVSRNNGKKVTEVSAVDAFMLAENNLNNAEFFTCSADSTLTHNYGKQSVYTFKQKLNGVIETQEISCSKMKSIANMTRLEDGKVYLYDGTPTSNTSATWSKDPSILSPEEFKKKVGVSAASSISYIVSEKTINDKDTNATVPGTATAVGANVYRFKLILNNSSSVMNYAKKIRYMSGLTDLPSFSTIELVFDIDSNFNFVSITSNEVYSFKYVGGIFVTCSGSITTKFNFKKSSI